MPVAGEKAIAFERHKHRAAEDKNVPDGHIIPLLPPLSFPSSLLKQLTPATWSSLCSWSWGTKLNLILRIKHCPLKAAPGLFCAPQEGSQHQRLHSQLSSSFQHPPCKQKLKCKETQQSPLSVGSSALRERYVVPFCHTW